MHVAGDAVALAPHHHGHLAMDLEADEPIDHVYALGFQRLGPFDVALFVEAGFQLHQRGHLLFFFDGFEQRLHDRRIAAGAIQAGLDGQYVGIVRGLLQEIDHRLERFVGMVQKNILLLDEREEIFLRAGLRQCGRKSRDKRRVLQIGPVQIVQVHQPAQGKRPVDAIDLARLHLQIVHQDFEDVGRHVLAHHQAHHVSRSASAARRLRCFRAGPPLPVP